MTTNLRRRLALRLYPDAERMLETARRQVDDAHAGRDRALRGLDDLAVRILSATLAVGRIGNVDVERGPQSGTFREHYPAAQVEDLLDTARAALLETEDVARYATQARRIAHAALGPRDESLALNTARGALDRTTAILAAALQHLGDGTDPDVELATAAILDAHRITREALTALGHP